MTRFLRFSPLTAKRDNLTRIFCSTSFGECLFFILLPPPPNSPLPLYILKCHRKARKPNKHLPSCDACALCCTSRSFWCDMECERDFSIACFYLFRSMWWTCQRMTPGGWMRSENMPPSTDGSTVRGSLRSPSPYTRWVITPYFYSYLFTYTFLF